MFWDDAASPFLYPSSRAVMCSIDPVYHKASNGKYYKLYYVPNGGSINQVDAQQMCKKRGGNLAMTYKPTDFEAIQHITQTLNQYNPVWIAGTDAVTEGNWVMPDGNNKFT
jgi:hypothetical protein